MNRVSLPAACRSLRVAALVVVVGLLAARLAAQEAPAAGSAAAGPVVELPKFVVTDDRVLPPPEAWRYAEIPGFEILTNASDKATKRLMRDFDLFRQALGYVWPLPSRGNVPTSLILCAKGNKFDAFVPTTESKANRPVASLFLKGKEQGAIILDLQATTLNVLDFDTTNDAATGTDSTQLSVDHDKQLYREYVRYLLSRSEPRLPAWLEEGMTQIIMRMKVDKKEIVVGELEDPNTISAQAGAVAAMNALTAADDPDGAQIAGAPAEDRDFNASLQRRALVPLAKFFAVAHDAPEAVNPLGNNIWAKQAYAFVHMCIYGEHKKYQKAFGTFVIRSSKEPLTEALFKECFKKTYKEMLVTLRGYIDFTVYDKQMFVSKGKNTGLLDPAPLDLRDATPSEVGRIKGEALILAGHPTRARTELTAPYIRGERDPRLLAALGLFDLANGEEVRGRKFINAATTAKVSRPRAYLEVARDRYAAALAKPAAADGQFSEEQVNAILTPLLVARTQPPSLPELYELMTDTWARSAVVPKREDVVFLVEGVRLFPGRLKMLYLAAGLSVQAGMLDVAHSFADYGIQVAPDAKTKAKFAELKTSLPPAPPVPAAAKAEAPASKKS